MPPATTVAPAPISGPALNPNNLNGQLGGAYGSTPDTSNISTTSSTNPVVSGTSTRSSNDSLGTDINTQIANLTNTGNEEATIDQNAIDSNTADYNSQISGLQTEDAQALSALNSSNAGAYAQRSTGLITSGGGFLGNTQSQNGVLQSLQQNQASEVAALQAKQQAALQAAKSAYDSKNFELASKLVSDANNINSSIQTANDNYATQQLNITKENQSQLEYNTGQTDKMATSYANLSPTDYANLPQSSKDQIDAVYYPGYMDALNKTTQEAKAVTDAKSQEGLDASIMDMRLKVPAGQSFTLNGQTYTGLNQGPKPTQSEVTAGIHQQLQTGILSGQTNPDGTQKYTIPGTNGIPFIDKNGFLTPQGFKAAYQISGLTRKDFIQTYGYLIPQTQSSTDTTWQQYGLTPAESKLLTSVVPADTAQ